MRRLFRLLVFIPIVWISLLCGASWTDAPRIFIERTAAPTPHESVQRGSAPAGAEIFALGESEAMEQLDAALSDLNEEIDATHGGSEGAPPRPRLLLEAAPKRGPPAALHPRHQLGFAHLLRSACLRASAAPRAPPARA